MTDDDDVYEALGDLGRMMDRITDEMSPAARRWFLDPVGPPEAAKPSSTPPAEPDSIDKVSRDEVGAEGLEPPTSSL